MKMWYKQKNKRGNKRDGDLRSYSVIARRLGYIDFKTGVVSCFVVRWRFGYEIRSMYLTILSHCTDCKNFNLFSNKIDSFNLIVLSVFLASQLSLISSVSASDLRR